MIRCSLSVVHSCVCVSRVLKIYRSFELRFGVKPELESESGSKPGSKLESSRVEALKVGTSDRVCQLVVKRRIREQGNKGNKGKKVKQKERKRKRIDETDETGENETNETNRKN